MAGTWGNSGDVAATVSSSSSIMLILSKKNSALFAIEANKMLSRQPRY